MNNLKTPNCKTPCKHCPFRKDCLPGWLGKERITEILEQDSFVCHKDTGLQCAGFMLIKGNESTYLRFAQAIKHDLNLKGKDLVFDSKKDCIEHHT